MRDKSRSCFRGSVHLPAEMAIGIAILAVTSLLIITTPPLAPHYSFARSTVSQGFELSLTEQPVRKRPISGNRNDSRANARPEVSKDGTGEDVKNMVVTLTNQAAGIGPIAAPV